MKQWMIKRNPADLKKIAERYRISEIFAEILVKRGLYDWNAMDEYLYPSMDKLHTVHDIYDMDTILKIANKHNICAFEFSLYLSYFCDVIIERWEKLTGLTATVL